MVFLEIKATTISVERSLGSTGDTRFRHIMFVIIESGMTLLVIQLVRIVFNALPLSVTRLTPVSMAIYYGIAVGEMFNVIIRSVHFYFFCQCLLKTFTWLGHHTNNNFGAGLNEIVLR